MAGATPDLRLPSQPQDIAAPAVTRLYCLVLEAQACEQLAQGRSLAVERPAVELLTSRVASRRLNHYTTDGTLYTLYLNEAKQNNTPWCQ